MRYLIYLRVSTDDQDVETQTRMCMERIYSLHPDGNFTFELFTDPEMSSGVPFEKRVELQKMLSSVTKGSTVLVYKLDRLSRDVIEMVTIYRTIVNRCEAKVLSLNDPYSDEFSVGLMGLIAQKERDTIRMRTRDKLATKRKKNERYSGKLPYGYTMHETHMVPIKVGKDVVYKRGVLVPIESEQEVLTRMKQFFAAGMSYHGIAKALTELGYRNREGNAFQKMSIYRILARIGQAPPSDQRQEQKAIYQCG